MNSLKENDFVTMTVMHYKLKTRKTKPFELYNNLEPGDIAELGFFLNMGEAPRKSGKKIVAEHLWAEIESVVYESNDIYRGKLTEEPKYLKHLRMGNTVAFSPENILSAKSKKPQKKIKGLKDFVYMGNDKKYAAFKQIITDATHSYAINPSVVVLRSSNKIAGGLPAEKLNEANRAEFENFRERFESIDLDKFNVKVDTDFIKKSAEKIRHRATTQKSLDAPSPLIRIADRSFLSYNLVGKLLVILKKMLVYLEFQEDFPMLYFTNKQYDGFISLAHHTSESVVVDFLEK